MQDFLWLETIQLIVSFLAKIPHQDGHSQSTAYTQSGYPELNFSSSHLVKQVTKILAPEQPMG